MLLQSVLHKRIPLIFLSLPLLLVLLQLAALSVACFILLWFVTLLQAWVAATLLRASSSQHKITFIFTFDTIFRRRSSSKTPSWLTQSETFSTITFNSLFTPSLFRIEFPSEPLCDGTNEPPPVRLRVHRSTFTALVVLTSVRAASWYPGVTGLRRYFPLQGEQPFRGFTCVLAPDWGEAGRFY